MNNDAVLNIIFCKRVIFNSTRIKMKKPKMFYEAAKGTFKNARMLRKRATDSEELLWQKLSKNQVLGLRFKRQHPIAFYVADFYCHKAKLVIELDGKYHDLEQQKSYDINRTAVLNELGLRVLRFSDKEIFEDIDRVVDAIKDNCPPPHTLNP
jgi:imidazole glycerol-phosphate synthase subunit HisF